MKLEKDELENFTLFYLFWTLIESYYWQFFKRNDVYKNIMKVVVFYKHNKLGLGLCFQMTFDTLKIWPFKALFDIWYIDLFWEDHKFFIDFFFVENHVRDELIMRQQMNWKKTKIDETSLTSSKQLRIINVATLFINKLIASITQYRSKFQF